MAYLTGTIEAVDFYCKAFNATSKNCFKAADGDDYYAHAEIIIDNQTILAISDTRHYDKEFKRANNMEFWLTFNDEKSLETAYDVLRDGAEIHQVLAPCEWSELMADLTDKYGIKWLLNVF
jgi:PhnB protein